MTRAVATCVSHPIFARFYGRWAAGAEKAGAAEHRRKLLAGLTGKVIEVGAGNGLNFGYYPTTVTQLIAIEPEPRLRRQAAVGAAGAAIPITVEDGTADRLPSAEAEFDAGVVSLVLCSVPDQATALAELYRVIRPGGELHYYEHVRSDRPKYARFQDRADLVWPLFAGGCHPNRATEAAIQRGGFEVEEHHTLLFQPCFLAKPVAPHVIGRARRS